jgi:hypothetical protein
MNQLFWHLPPILSIIGYINYPKDFKINQNLLNILSIIHNSALILFSGTTFILLSKVLYQKGIIYQSNYYFQDPFFEKIMYYFYLSKYYEFIDTFILYLHGKNPLFLQKFHHIGAVICWHLCYVYKVDSIWIPTFVNSFIHTIMYSYYLGCLLKINKVRFIKQYLTSLQLIQLTIPNYFSLYYYYPPAETIFKYNIIKIFTVYVFCLVILFGQFYYNNYIVKNKIK